MKLGRHGGIETFFDQVRGVFDQVGEPYGRKTNEKRLPRKDSGNLTGQGAGVGIGAFRAQRAGTYRVRVALLAAVRAAVCLSR